MTASSGSPPVGPSPDGIVSRRSPWAVAETVSRLVSALEANGVKLFATIDHSGEAARAGLTLRDTKLLVFGNPVAGTPLMQEKPLIALDLPLKVLVWQDEDDEVWMTHLAGQWLAGRYGIAANLANVLSAVDALVDHVASSPS
jgi:uncharacterized protein (DUF302 family)